MMCDFQHVKRLKEELKLRQLLYFFDKVQVTSERRILHRILRKRYVR